MDKHTDKSHSLKNLSLAAWRTDNRHEHAHVRDVNKSFSQRLRLRDDAPTVN